MLRKKIAVIRGGPSHEYDVSLKTGAEILSSLSDDKYNLLDICITREGDWYFNGAKIAPAEILPKIDVVFNALHGEFGEDGRIQRIFETFKIPYTGSSPIPSALAMNKVLAKREFQKVGAKVPIDIVLKRSDYNAAEIFQTFPMPAVVKPIGAGSSLGVGIAKTIIELEQAIQNAFEISDKVLVEEYISGREATCGVVDNFRLVSPTDKEENIYTLLPVEIKPKSADGLFDYDAKYSGESKEICPGNFTKEEKEEIQKLAKQAHRVLGLRHYSRSDFIVSPRRGIYFLETNSLPGLTQNSLFPLSLRAVGSSLEEFVEHLIELAEK